MSLSRTLVVFLALAPFAVGANKDMQELQRDVWPLFAAGKLKVVIDSTFALADAADAHRRGETSRHIGKILLEVRHG